MARPPTNPGFPPTVEGLSYRLEGQEQGLDNLRRTVRAAGETAQRLEKELVELRGLDGRGGLMGWIKEEQSRSSAAQGVRLEEAKSERDRLRATVEVLERRLDGVEKAQVDLRARWGSAVAVIMAIASLIAQFFKGG